MVLLGRRDTWIVPVAERSHACRPGGEWRRMHRRDLPAVEAIAEIAHRDHPEDPEVFAERLRLPPEGCLIVERGCDRLGYVLSHPWAYLRPPDLNARLGGVPLPRSPAVRSSRRRTRSARSCGAHPVRQTPIHDGCPFGRRRKTTESLHSRAARLC
jgi:hypothetical protein